VWIPRCSSRSCVRGPTPHSAPIGSGVRNSSSLPAAISVSPSGLFMPLGNLCEELHPRDPHRAGQRGLGPHRRADRLRGLTRRPPQPLRTRQIDKSLVDRQPLHQRRKSLERFQRPDATPPIGVVPRRDHHRVRAQPQRHRHRLRRATAERPRLVAGRRDHAPLPRPADQHRLAAQARVVANFHRGEERVHVDVQYRALGSHRPAQHSANARRINASRSRPAPARAPRRAPPRSPPRSASPRCPAAAARAPPAR
jgi:hypothetical protein